MKIASIILKNFRSFKDETEIPLNDNITVFVGENNVGKSNIATAIKKLKLFIESKDNYHLQQGQVRQQIFTQSDWNLDNTDEPLKILLKIKLNNTEQKQIHSTIKKTFIENNIPENYPFEIPKTVEILFDNKYDSNLKPPLVKISDIYFQDTKYAFEPEAFSSDKGSTILDSYISAQSNTPLKKIDYHNNNYIIEALMISESKTVVLSHEPKIYSTVMNLFTNNTKPFNEIRVLPNKPKTRSEESFDGSELAGVLLNLKDNTKRDLRDKYKLIQSYFKENFPMLELEVVDNDNNPEIKIIRTHNKHEHPLHQAGTGIFEFLVQLVSLVETKDSFFIFEEPELHLHPSAQKLLFNIIRESSKINQIIIITHSIYFLDINNINQNIVIKNNHGQTSINTYTSVLTPQETSKIHKELSCKNREIFFSKIILLVEGETEYAAFYELATKIGFSLDSNNIFVCSVEGCGSFETYTKILNAFKFPYVLVADKDAENLDSVKNTLKKVILDPDFEGVLVKAGFKQISDEAKKVHKRSKPRQGEYIAEQIPADKIPQPYQDIILKLKEVIKENE